MQISMRCDVNDGQVMRAKVSMLAALVRGAERCVAYTGAGISTASGIDDYATVPPLPPPPPYILVSWWLIVFVVVIS